MIEPTSLAVSGERFSAIYEFTGALGDAVGRAEALCVEQTIEFPADLIPDDDIRNQIIGRVESREETGPESVRFEISYAVETTGFELPQLLNVLFGNSSLLPDVKLVDVRLPPVFSRSLGGPRFGMEGLRRLFAAPDRPLLATALKPMGSPPERLAAMAYELALGGVDMIKDDHSLANQPFATFEARVSACSEAVEKANERTGLNTIYLPSINAPQRLIEDRIRFALDAGAGGLLALPGIMGFEHMRDLACRSDIGVPIMGHPALLGGFVSSPTGGITHGVLYGTWMRFAGADVSVFPNHRGRFSFSPESCLEIADACREPLNGFRPIFPAPGGGMTGARIGEIVEFFGRDVVLLVGGDLHRGENLTQTAEAFRAAVE